MFVLVSTFVNFPEQPVPVIRAATIEEIGAIVESQSHVNAETMVAEWKEGSPLARFVHPQVFIDQKVDPVQHVGTKEEWIQRAADAYDQQVGSIPSSIEAITPEILDAGEAEVRRHLGGLSHEEQTIADSLNAMLEEVKRENPNITEQTPSTVH